MSAVLRYLFRRIVLAIPVLLGVATLVFSLIHLVPGDPAQAMLGEGASPQDVAELRRNLGLDRPLLTQYGVFLRRAVTGDLGVSFRTGQPVTTMIAERVPATAELAFAAMAVAVIIALPLGIIAAVWRGSVIDYGAMTFALAGISIPNFWLGPLLAILFSVELGWLPVSGRGHARASRAAGGVARSRAGGDPRAHDAGQPARRARRAVCAGGAGAGRVAIGAPWSGTRCATA